MLAALPGLLFAVVATSVLATGMLLSGVIVSVSVMGVVLLVALALMALLGRFTWVLASTGVSALFLLYAYQAPSLFQHDERTESFSTLMGFLGLALMLAFLSRQLQLRTQTALRAVELAEFSKETAELLARQTTYTDALVRSCELLSHFLQTPVATMAAPMQGGGYIQLVQFPSDAHVPWVPEAALWSAQNARTVGPGTDNWPHFPLWYVPFSRLPSLQPVLLVGVNERLKPAETLSFLRSFSDQVSAAYERLLSLEKMRQAELTAERQRLQNSFLASISHDMRTPLTAILGASSTLLEQGKDMSEFQKQHLLEGLNKEIHALVASTDNIFSLLRLQNAESDSLLLDWQSPEEILGLSLARFSDALSSGRLQAHAQPVSGLVRAHAPLLTQAFYNLIDNALKANESFEPVVVGLRQVNETIEFFVADRGIGFPEGFQIEQIRRFQRFDTSSKGVGLGLTIVQAIARLHNAEFLIQRRPEGGTEVALSFALEQPQEVLHA